MTREYCRLYAFMIRSFNGAVATSRPPGMTRIDMVFSVEGFTEATSNSSWLCAITILGSARTRRSRLSRVDELNIPVMYIQRYMHSDPPKEARQFGSLRA